MKSYGLWYAIKFILPFMWKGGCAIRFQVVLSFMMIVTSKLLNNVHPIILANIVNTITLGDMEDAYMPIIYYVIVKFFADFIYTLREIAFANVSASSEVFIAEKVYNHVQSLSLAYHV